MRAHHVFGILLMIIKIFIWILQPLHRENDERAGYASFGCFYGKYFLCLLRNRSHPKSSMERNKNEGLGHPQPIQASPCRARMVHFRYPMFWEEYMKFTYRYQSPVGVLRIIADEHAISAIRLEKSGHEDVPVAANFDLIEEKTPLITEAVEQLEEYFAGTRKRFNLPLAPEGTDFQKKDWAALQDIPYGETRTYKDMAEAIGCPKGFRAVGLANNRNPIIIVIPCHRVIGADGKLVGYGGGLDVKERLLKLEGSL